MLSPNTILQNRYRVIRELGHGGMGTVYEALDQRVNCIVALKETIAGNNEEARRAFEREASLLGNLRHSALPKVMDYFSENEGDFLVMEFIAGHDLAELLVSRGSPFPQSQVLGWADELLKLLEYLHASHPPILHRDIKPANLKLTDQGAIFLLDFGLAKGSTGQMPTLVTSRSVFGYTPSYASLEQILGQGTDPRSDLYSLGATLYHLLAGVPPTNAPTRLSAIEEEQPDPLQPIEKVNPLCSPSVAAIIHQAMAISRKNRPASAAEMRKALLDAVEEVDREEQGDAQRRDQIPPTVLASTVRAQEPSLKKQASQPALETMHAPPPDRVSFDQFSASVNAQPEFAPAIAVTSKRNLVIGAVLLVVFASVAFLIWSLSGKNSTNPSSTNRSPTNSSLSNAPRTRTNQAGIEFVLIPPGNFMMGSANGKADEKPVHQVTISQSFYIGKYEVTQGQWQAVMGNNPSNFKDCGGNCPVENVSWNDAQSFINKLNESNDGFRYRLPTEAEWEYACRAGTTGDYAGDLDAMAWYGNNSGRGRLDAAEILRTDSANYYKRITENGGQTHAVGTKLPNSFGLFDMHGNVWEWCQDWYHDSYNGAPTDGSAWSSGGEQKYRVLRGGSWDAYASYLRSAVRYNFLTPDIRGNFLGFRVVAVVRTS